MSTWLKLLPLEMTTVEDFREPTDKIDPRYDHIVGEMSDDLKRLYTLWMQIDRESERLAHEAKWESDEAKKRQLVTNVYEIYKKAEILQEIFWISLKDDYQLWDKPSVGVRKNYQVVWTEERNPFDIFRL